ncbi:MAG: hypothetical protein OXU23_05355 [Candidatus Poribacteria bacterium]|nr:hypothetical protein [Candidatus Poribacteria bacterium]
MNISKNYLRQTELIFALIICIAFLLTACATTGEKIKHLNIDMTRAEVINVLGRPDGVQKSGEYEALKYAHRLVTGWAWDRADYNFILKNGKVVEYGPGEVRVKEGPTSILLIVPMGK